MPDPKKGLYRKFTVFRVPPKGKGGVSPVGNAFVLLPEKDPAAIDALKAYVEHDEVAGTKLALDLLRWIQRVEEGVLYVSEGEGEDGSEGDISAEDGGADGEASSEERGDRLEGLEAVKREAASDGTVSDVGAEAADEGRDADRADHEREAAQAEAAEG